MENQISIADISFKPFLSNKQIKERIQEIAVSINHKFKGKKPLFLAILNGCSNTIAA